MIDHRWIQDQFTTYIFLIIQLIEFLREMDFICHRYGQKDEF